MFTPEQQISQLFGSYFHQDYDLMVEDFDRNKPIIPQLVQGYKNDSPQEDVDQAIKELENLINQHYALPVLREIWLELGIDINVNAFGYTHQQFLIEVLRLLKE